MTIEQHFFGGESEEDDGAGAGGPIRRWAAVI